MADNGFKVNKSLNLNPQTAQPANAIDGDVYYDSSVGTFAYYHSGSWANLDSIGALATSANMTSAQFIPSVIVNSVIRLTGSAASVHGMSASFSAKRLIFYNNSSGNINLIYESATEVTANNRIHTPTGGNMVLVPGEIAQFMYDVLQNRWLLVSISSGASAQVVATTTNNGIVTLHQASATPTTPNVLTDGDLNTANGVVGLNANKAAVITSLAGSTGLTVTAAAGQNAISAITSTTGKAFLGTGFYGADLTGTNTGAFIQGASGSGALGVQVFGDGSGMAGEFTAGATAYGIRVFGGTDKAAIIGHGSTSGVGVDFTNFATIFSTKEKGAAVVGYAEVLLEASAFGVVGIGKFGGSGVVGFGEDAADAVGNGILGYGALGGGYGVYGIARLTSSVGVRGDGGSTGRGVEGHGGATSGEGGFFYGTGGTSAGAVGQGAAGGGVGLYGIGGAGSGGHGVRGDATYAAASGVYSTSTLGPGGTFIASGSGYGLDVQSTSGTGIRVALATDLGTAAFYGYGGEFGMDISCRSTGIVLAVPGVNGLYGISMTLGQGTGVKSAISTASGSNASFEGSGATYGANLSGVSRGVLAISTTSGGIGVEGTGSGTAGIGVKGTGAGSSGIGVEGIGAASGAGHGIKGTGGNLSSVSSAGHGILAIGGTNSGAGLDGYGGHFTGGSTTAIFANGDITLAGSTGKVFLQSARATEVLCHNTEFHLVGNSSMSITETFRQISTSSSYIYGASIADSVTVQCGGRVKGLPVGAVITSIDVCIQNSDSVSRVVTAEANWTDTPPGTATSVISGTATRVSSGSFVWVTISGSLTNTTVLSDQFLYVHLSFERTNTRGQLKVSGVRVNYTETNLSIRPQ